ncbi:hypothetical protein SmJEL517_g01842 [Synchytrium microbalum]|uniref:Gluconokinase n=1 Tax=Synchytrium microbalum TaxID=1806994 RepID=A0A507CEA0_9FUNG|nr:uncharacterized protein SmJEL517_g01842 [Synchytrium microbalum]TPX35905.1 hypothetical protein SmJEL517_g01842 [Synchytrium microbalum]
MKLILVMGVSSSGKSTIASLLSDSFNANHTSKPSTFSTFMDADTYHPASNLAKMSSGIPLTDTDRIPWLTHINTVVKQQTSDIVVLGCSALKRGYRDILKDGVDKFVIVYLEGGEEVLRRRIEGRKGHFMKANMLTSQLATLEVPTSDEASQLITVNIDQSMESIVKEIESQLGI